jgi:phosphoglycerate dehydrogenase-like enzyme
MTATALLDNVQVCMAAAGPNRTRGMLFFTANQDMAEKMSEYGLDQVLTAKRGVGAWQGGTATESSHEARLG